MGPEPAGRGGATGRAAYLLLLGFLAGFAVMALEITAPRLLAPYFGSTVHVWTNIIGIILFALSLGYFAGGKLADLRPEPALLCRILLLGSLLAAVVPFAGPALSRFILPEDLGLEAAFGAFFGGSLLVTFILYFPPSVFLAMAGPFLIRCLARERGVGVSAGTVYGVSTIGSLLGTFLPTLVLVPGIGTRRTILAAVLPLALAALPGALRRRRALPAAAIALAGGALLALAGHLPLRGGPGLLAEAESAYQYVRVQEEGDVRVLTMSEGMDSFHSVSVRGSILTGRYYDFFSALPPLAPPGRFRALILGLAGGTAARQYLHFFGDRLDGLDGVEIDPVVTGMGVRFLGLDPARVRILHRDARAVLRTLPAGGYRVIAADVYASQVYVPPHLATREFFLEAARVLEPGGVLGINLGGFTMASPVARAIANTLAAAFGGAFLTEVPASRNFLAFAFRPPAPPWPPPMPEDLSPDLAGLVETVLSYRTIRLEPDPKLPVLTDDHCPVEELTDREWRALYRTLRREAASLQGPG